MPKNCNGLAGLIDAWKVAEKAYEEIKEKEEADEGKS